MLVVIEVDDLETFIDTIYGCSNFFHNNIGWHFIYRFYGIFYFIFNNGRSANLDATLRGYLDYLS
jgi:hypothetical protein